MSQIKYINLADLELPEFEAHNLISAEQILEISESIKEIGIIEPLIIRKINGQLEIVAGCVRYNAAKLAGLKAVPCIIMKLKDDEAEILKLHENIKRVNLDHVDQGNTFLMMQTKFNMTIESIANSVGKSIAYVSQHISLVSQDSVLSTAVKNGDLSFSHARELLQVDNIDTRRELQSYCQRDGATIQVLRSWIKEYYDQKAINTVSNKSSVSSDFQYVPVSDFRHCEACGTETPLGQIRQIFYCPPCHTAIKQAIEEEKAAQR